MEKEYQRPPYTSKKGLAELQNITREYRHCDIFNMDESAYFYCTAYSTSVSRSGVAGREKIKKRLTIAITTNSDGSFQVPLLFVGTAKKPRCFGNHTADELGINYTNAAKGWMTAKFFRTWLGYLSDTMRSQDRHCQVPLPAPNTTAHLQPQGAGIIKSFKSQLSKIRDNYVVEKLDAMLEQVDAIGEEDTDKRAEQLFNVSISVAMRWDQQAWDELSKATFVSCCQLLESHWNSCGRN
uniref:Uncharacterized protein AlNc14C3G519 n=1 Tax=Albugo laibachii Nc14 TaxID=890382 RepID=F0W051_9STRA|nr:hypothetical protein TRIADDRAFT_5525 [Albugo laibachii Nc14]|eukprot:CCA14422.1 hypothetical protein TRIADDRAFT_5525 [Albugo laibachii Nc14]